MPGQGLASLFDAGSPAILKMGKMANFPCVHDLGGFLFASRAKVVQIKLVSVPGKFLKGKLLLDSGQLSGSFFQRTVVLICEHNAEGAFGLVLNRSLGKKVGEMIVADLPDTLRESPLFLGGPVQPTALSFLHADNFIPDANVFPNLSLGHSLDDLVEVGESFSAQKKVKMFAGYAGWSPGQLGNRNETQGVADVSRVARTGL